MEDFYDLVDRAVDTAFEENKFYFKAYDYLIANKIKRKQITEFIESSTAVALGTLVDDLEGYLKGGKKEMLGIIICMYQGIIVWV